MSIEDNVEHGMELGAVLALAISWSINKSIWWAIVHSVFGWGYVIYYSFGYAS